MSASVPFTVRLPLELHERLEERAALELRSRSWLVARAVEEYLEEPTRRFDQQRRKGKR